MSWLCGVIWRFSEWSGIGLGRVAPWVFGGMIGHRPRRSSMPDKGGTP